MLLFVNAAHCVDSSDWKRGDNSDAIKGTSNVSDVDTELATYVVNPLNLMLPGTIYGCTLTWATNATVTIGVGSVVCSNSAGTVHRIRKNTSTVTITLPANGASGDSLDTGNAAVSTWYHIFAIADTADSTTFTGKCSASASAPTGYTYYRYLGSFYNNASDNIAEFYWTGMGNTYQYMWDIPTNVATAASAGAWSAAISCATAIPSTSNLGIFGLKALGEGSTNSCAVYIRPNGQTWATNESNGVYAYGIIGGQRVCALDSSQQIQYYNDGSDPSCRVDVEGFIGVR